MSVAAVVLAAGASRRLGRPKQTVLIGNETLLARSVRVALEAGMSPVIVVVADRSLCDGIAQSNVITLQNETADEGMASSIRVGIAYAKTLPVLGAVIMTCDQPGVGPEHLRALIAGRSTVTGSGYGGRTGVPAYFPAETFDALMLLTGDTGARDLLRAARVVRAEGLGLDVDTEEDVLQARVLFEHDDRRTFDAPRHVGSPSTLAPLPAECGGPSASPQDDCVKG